jgi:hypothetical protein
MKANIEWKGKKYTFNFADNLTHDDASQKIRDHEYLMFMEERNDPNYSRNGKKEACEAFLKALQLLEQRLAVHNHGG